MSTKLTKNSERDLEKEVMSKITSGQINMKPKWYFVAGSVLSLIGLISFSIVSVFLINLTLFLLRKHGPMGQWRLELLLSSFPLWIPIVAVVSIFLGVWLLKKYDFAYKKNFLLIILGFVFSVVVAGFIIDWLGLNNLWVRGKMMKRLYRVDSRF